MRILKNFILTLCILSFFNFGGIEKVNAAANGHFSPLKEANIAFVGFGNSGKSGLRATLAEKPFDFDADPDHTMRDRMFHTGLPVDDGHGRIYTVDCKLWDTSGQPKDKDRVINSRCKDMDIVIIMISLYDPHNAGLWRDVIRKNLLEWEREILCIKPEAKIILACTKSDLANPNDLGVIQATINNFTDADQALGGSVKSVVLSAKTGHNLNALMQIIEDDLREIGLNNLPDLPEEEDKDGICLLL